MRDTSRNLLIVGMIAGGAMGVPVDAAAKPAVHSVEPIRQMALSDAKIVQFIAARPALDGILADVLPGVAADPQLMRRLNDTARKNGFANFDDYEAVATNIVWILSGIDPLSKKYIGVQAVTKLEVADLLSDKTLSARDKKLRFEALHAQMQSAAPVRYAANISLVTKLYDQLLAKAASN